MTNQRNLVLLTFALLVVMLGFGMVIPVLPFYIERLGAGGSAYGSLVAIAALTEFLFGPFWGSLSDRTGRKPILMIGILGYGLAMLFFGLSTELWMLYASRALSGVLSAAAMSSAMAYIGDSTSEKARGGGMGLFGAAAGAGTIIGPGIGGLFAKGSLSTPFFIAAGMSLVSLALIALLLPESLPRGARVQAQGRLRFVNLGDLWQALFSPIGFLLFMAFLATFGTSNFEAIFSMYILKKLNYSPESIGAILTGVGFVALIGRGLLTGLFTRLWGEPVVIKASILTAALGFVFLLLADSFTIVLLSTGFFVFAVTFLRPSIHSLTSQRATIGQGAALGLSNSFVSMGRIAGSLWAGAIFDVKMEYPYLSGVAIMLVCFVLSARLARAGDASQCRAAPNR
ncbi:MAG: MFS transporter [Anaerolineae bacterium]|nr:MFS transporter [Anaerolineae bacterium]